MRRRRITEKEREDHLQEASQFGESFARGQSIQMIICNRLVHPGDYKRLVHPDHLQEAVPSGLFVEVGWSILVMVCKRLVDPNKGRDLQFEKCM